MTQQEIIEMARLTFSKDLYGFFKASNNEIEAFAKLVSAAAVFEEREACAKVCEWYSNSKRANINYSEECAQAIRARGEA